MQQALRQPRSHACQPPLFQHPKLMRTCPRAVPDTLTSTTGAIAPSPFRRRAATSSWPARAVREAPAAGPEAQALARASQAAPMVGSVPARAALAALARAPDWALAPAARGVLGPGGGGLDLVVARGWALPAPGLGGEEPNRRAAWRGWVPVAAGLRPALAPGPRG